MVTRIMKPTVAAYMDSMKTKNEKKIPYNSQLYKCGRLPHLQSSLANIKTSLWPPLLIC